ncbi:myocyte-specific enhancer factor 2d [Diaporthe amygdali]|uniref:myocyte-specific enhancer factor 2d n=1 Tax=Phomopsis amygdali TaxID=1214568 RepID=UPI0022FE278A|nr:myocyte-specific enhancer factor 2d [Diaporthe amygdali]KAJ0124902.1 myocyte-specific enhancer factor 2d [Diaporthe amygdali]
MAFLSNLAPRLPREIPGFYYDEEKKRYFKIESHPTAPSNAAWAAGNVKKRKAEKAQAQQKRKRQEKLKGCIKRSSLLAHPLAGGRLAREFGVVDPELPVESWTAGLRQRGEVSFWPGQEQSPDAPNISCLLVEGGDEEAGLGMVYAAVDGRQLQASYLPTDKDDKINFGITQRMRASRLSALRVEAIQDDISSISYHQASHTMIVTSTAASGPDMSSRGKINLFQPARPADLGEGNWEGHFLEQYGGRRPTWLLGDTGAYVSYTSPVRGLTMHTARTCPPSTSGSSGLDALIATSHGIMGVDGSRAAGEVYWVTPKPPAGGNMAQPRHQQQHHHHGTRPPPRDVFSVDYHHSNPRVCFAGCRDARVHRIDTRAPFSTSAGSGWDWFRHRSSAAHVRCIDDHRVLVAGPRSAMAIYDSRWVAGPRMRPGGSGGNNNAAAAAHPVVQFAGYRNEAHVRIGLDITHDVGGTAGLGSGGVVAAGLGDGTVGVFSLRTGRRLRAGDVDGSLGAVGAGGVVQALQFRRLPWEREASLFAGVGPVVRKFTFGVEDGEDEW